MANLHSFACRTFCVGHLKFLLVFLIAIFIASDCFSLPRTPSQAFPDMFRKPPGSDFDYFKRKQTDIPAVPETTQDIELEDEVIITPSSIIILTPQELQNVIDVKKFENIALQRNFNTQGLYDLAFQIEQEFSQKGYPLVRVTLPIQELEPENATIFFKIIDGFIEKIDLSKVPKNQRLRTFAYLKQIIKKKSLKLSNLERQLLLASNSSGTTLTTSLIAGNEEGGTILLVEGKHKLLSGGVTIDNSQNKELGRKQGQLRASLHSPLGLGETITAYGLAKASNDGIFGSGYNVPIRAGGVAISLPLASNGLNLGTTYTESMTRPGEDVESLGLEANMKSASINVSYPVIYKRDVALLSRASINWIDEIQHTNAGGTDEEISHDRITSVKAGVGLNRCTEYCLSLDAEITKGLEIGSRSRKDVGLGTPLSRDAADVNFSHLRVSAKYEGIFFDNYNLSINSGGQYSFSGSLLNSEQMGVAGENRLSGIASGGISGDEAWYIRTQASKKIQLSNNLGVSPYVYAATGISYLSDPSSAERKSTSARATGVGLEFGGTDDLLVEKSVTGKFEFSKNWASSNLEKTHDTRFSNNQMFLKLSMNF